MKNLILVFLLMLMVSPSKAQYRRTNNEMIILASHTEEVIPKAAIAAGSQFFEFARMRQRSAWEDMLSESCLADSLGRDKIDRWYRHLSQSGTRYQLLHEYGTSGTGQKIFTYSDPQSNRPNQKRSVILILEKGEWKILHIFI